MRLEENPFYILGASIYDDKNKIQELAEDKTFFDDEDNGDIYERAATTLTSPKKRLAAEMRWFIGCDDAQVAEIVDSLESWDFYSVDLDCELAEINYSIYVLNYDLDEYFIWQIDLDYSYLDVEEIQTQINSARAISKFPPIRDIAAIKSELKNLRDEIRRSIHSAAKNLDEKDYVKLAAGLAKYHSEGVIVEDFFTKIYYVDMMPRIENYQNKLAYAIKNLDDNPTENNFKNFEGVISALTEILRPLNAAAIEENFSEEIFTTVRLLATLMHNEKNLTDEALRVIGILLKYFNHDDEFRRIAEKDIVTLRRIQQDNLHAEKIAQTGRKIINLAKEIKNKPDATSINNLERDLNIFVDAAKNYEDAEESIELIFNAVRNAAIDLFNEKNLIDEPLQILKILLGIFWRIPEIRNSLDNDIKILEGVKAEQPTKIFEEAESTLDEIFKMLGRNFHFEQGFQWENLQVSEDFQENYEWKILNYFRRAGYKPSELEKLNLIAAAIYNRLSIGLSYAGRFDLAKESLEKALPYAQNSNDKKILSTVYKNLDDCKKYLSQQNSSGCAVFIVAIVTAVLLGIF